MIEGYTSLGILGRGAESTIHKVQCQKTGSYYALKQVKRENDPQGWVFEQMQTEFKVGQNVSHQNVRQMVKIIKSRKLLKVTELYLLMELLEGKTLEQKNPTDLIYLLGIFTHVARGLQAIHEAGYVHADIKPNNIMLCEGNRVKIFDLGQACPIASTKKRIQGTPDFIAPEQVLKLPLDERTDVFNLGASMYWCLTGKMFPTRIRSQQRSSQTVNLDRVSEISSPQEHNPAIPFSWSNLVMDCCRNSPASRPANMGEVLTRLKAVASALQRNGDVTS